MKPGGRLRSFRAAAPVLLLVLAMSGRAQDRAPLALTAGESRTVGLFGVTAAWSVDPAIVDVLAQKESISVVARAAGRTTIVIVGVTGQHVWDVVVRARAGNAPATAAPNADRGTAEVRYS